MKKGRFILEVHVAGFTLECSVCGREIYLSEASAPNEYDGEQILKLAAKHECPKSLTGGPR